MHVANLLPIQMMTNGAIVAIASESNLSSIVMDACLQQVSETLTKAMFNNTINWSSCTQIGSNTYLRDLTHGFIPICKWVSVGNHEFHNLETDTSDDV